MKSEKEKSHSGELYKAFGEELLSERQEARKLISQFNALPPDEIEKRNLIIKKLFGKTGKSFFIEPPFRCDYGYNISIGENFYANFNCIVLDCVPVKIGNNVLFGPGVNIYTAGHPVHHELRSQEYEFALPITIGDNVWIGGNSIVNPGISIGDNSVIGSGSMVTRNIPSNVIAAGNPCKILRKITDADKLHILRD
jgi:galactoside O-acetyltransferase